MLKIHLGLEHDEWRAMIDPKDRNAWFRNYGDIVKRYARIGQTEGVEQLCLGAELYRMTSSRVNGANTQNWVALIKDVRGLYSGKLAYSAQRGGETTRHREVWEIGFWDKLDYVGLSSYYPLGELKEEFSVPAIVARWDAWNKQEIKPIADRYKKPIIFTEIGYRSVTAAHVYPWLYWDTDAADEGAQATLYEALMTYWHTDARSHMKGAHFWKWRLGARDANFATDWTPQHKMAQDVLWRWLAPETNVSSLWANSCSPTGTSESASVWGTWGLLRALAQS